MKNTGRVSGSEVVQLYVNDLVSSVSTPVKALRRFAKLALSPGEEQTIEFALGPEDLRLLDRRMKWVVEPGEFEVTIGGLSGTFKG